MDFRDRNLVNIRMAHADLSGGDLREADLRYADLRHTKFAGCDLSRADLRGAMLAHADLSECNLQGSKLDDANLSGSDLTNSSLEGASLINTCLVGARVQSTRLRGALVYGVSAWDLNGEPSDQTGLVLSLSRLGTPVLVDDIRVAQLLHLLLDNSNLRVILDSTAKKAVLILGRFSSEGMQIISSLRGALHDSGLIPIVFDFQSPSSADLSKTVEILGRLVGAIVVDLTDPSCVPYELRALVPEVSTPLFPLIRSGNEPFAMFADLAKYPWVRDPIEYGQEEDALDVIARVVRVLDA